MLTFPAEALQATWSVDLSWKLSMTIKTSASSDTRAITGLAGASAGRPGCRTTVNAYDLLNPVAVSARTVISLSYVGGNEVHDSSIILPDAFTSRVGIVKR